MNRVIITMMSIIAVIGAIVTAVIIFYPNQEQDIKNEQIKIADENIVDECTEEYEQIYNNEMLQVDSQEDKLSPNCSLILKTYCTGCGHTKRQYQNLPESLVNCTKNEVKEKYPDYNIEDFKTNEVILIKEVEGECGEHYIVKDNNGKVCIYNKLEDGKEELLEETSISTEYLTQTDIINMKNGINVNGKENLNQLIEDFE